MQINKGLIKVLQGGNSKLVVGKEFSGEPVNWKLVRGSQDGTEKRLLFFCFLFFPSTVEVNVTTKDRHYLVVKVNCSDVHYYIVVKVNTFYFTFFILICDRICETGQPI